MEPHLSGHWGSCHLLLELYAWPTLSGFSSSFVTNILWLLIFLHGLLLIYLFFIVGNTDMQKCYSVFKMPLTILTLFNTEFQRRHNP